MRKLRLPTRSTQTSPNEANVVIEAQPSATPKTAPASTSLKKCIPSTTRDNAILTAKKTAALPARDKNN